MARSSIAILTHSSDQFHRRRSLVKLMIPRWHSMGIRVEVVTESGPFVEADLALLHVNQSVIPDSVMRVARMYPRVLNGAVLDIRKRTFSRVLVASGDADVQGPVIVKTDRNYGGFPEFLLETRQSLAGRLLGAVLGRKRAVRYLRRLDRRRSWRHRRTLRSYVVYMSCRDVPAGVWANENLVVERFLAELQGDLYCCRHWLFFGDAEVSRRTMSPDPMVKLAAGNPTPLAEPVPGQLREIRARLGFDYGKFDYGIVNGEVVLYDTNRTPGANADPRMHDQTIEVLSRGILTFAAQRLLVG